MITYNKSTFFQCTAFPDVLELSPESTEFDMIRINNSLKIQIILSEIDKNKNLYITFPWGENESDFTNKQWGQSIRAYTLSEWKLNDGENDKWGRYWILSPERTLQKNLAIQFDKINILAEGISCLRVYIGKNDKSQKDENAKLIYEIPILKKAQFLRIEEFRAKKRFISVGEPVSLKWCALGAENCIIDPGNIVVPVMGEIEIYTDKSCIYTLRAKKNGLTVSKKLKIFINGTN